MTSQLVPPVEQGRRRSTPLPRPGTKRRSLRHGDRYWAYLLIVPTAIGLTVFSIWPALQTFYFSFTKWGTFGGHEWTGFDNYTQVVHDPELLRSLWNTVIFSVMTLLGIPLSIGLAALLNTKGLRWVSVYRAVYFLPVVTMPAAIALVWKLIYNGDTGILNQFLAVFGIDGPHWLSDPATAIYAVGIVSIWSSLGYNMVLFIAGMQSIPGEFYEAASIDGAGTWRQFFGITMPLLTPTTFFVTVITVINALQAFDLVYLMVGKASPAIEESQTVVYLFYAKGILQGDGGYAAAIAFALLALILLITALQFRAQKRWVHYE